MNAVEIEEAISALAERSFDAQEFPFSFLEAFGNKETTIKRCHFRRQLFSSAHSNCPPRGGLGLCLIDTVSKPRTQGRDDKNLRLVTP